LPLSAKARIEVYLPDLPAVAYHRLRETLEREFTYTFGGCTVLRGLDGNYLARLGMVMRDRITLIYTDSPFSLEENWGRLARYADNLRDAAFAALDEEAVLVAVHAVWHAE
jgi:hypothetical protein